MEDQDKLWFEVGKIMVRTKRAFPTHYRTEKGKNVVTDAVYTVDVQEVLRKAKEQFLLSSINKVVNEGPKEFIAGYCTVPIAFGGCLSLNVGDPIYSDGQRYIIRYTPKPDGPYKKMEFYEVTYPLKPTSGPPITEFFQITKHD